MPPGMLGTDRAPMACRSPSGSHSIHSCSSVAVPRRQPIPKLGMRHAAAALAFRGDSGRDGVVTGRVQADPATDRAQKIQTAPGNRERPMKRGRGYSLVTGFPFPLGPFFERQTLRFEAARGQVWTFEQPQNLAGSNVHTNVRMTAVRLRSGGLLIYAPIAPTRECVALVEELGLPVEHILLPSFAYEHKVFVGPFSRKFPSAQIWVAPEQWSFPLRLPLPFLGIFRATPIVAGGSYPWSDDFDHRVLTVNISKGIGPYSEVALFHRPSRTLLLVDAAVTVPAQPPAVIPEWSLQFGRPAGPVGSAAQDAGGSSFFVRLLYGDTDKQEAEDERIQESRGEAAADAERGKLGWMRMCLQVLFFAPVNLLEPQDSFRRFQGRLIVSPVVRVLVFSKVPKEVAAWVEDIASSWRFNTIIPCHFDAPIAAGPTDLRAAFAWAYKAAGMSPPPSSPALQGFFSRFFGEGRATRGGGTGGNIGGPGDKGDGASDELFDPADLKALQTLSGALRKAGVTIEDPI